MAYFYITGVSGVGKSSVVQELNKRGILAYDIDTVPNLCHWRNKSTLEKANYYSGIGKDWLEQHDWICDKKMLTELLGHGADNVVIAGIASNQNEFLNLFDKIVLLHCNKETLLDRLTNRNGDNDFAKDKSEQEHVLSWYKDYENELLNQGAIAINTEEPLTMVVEKILNEIKSA